MNQPALFELEPVEKPEPLNLFGLPVGLSPLPRQCKVCGEWSPNGGHWRDNHGDAIAAFGGLCIREFYKLPPSERYSQ